jgi:hypothetical protein
MKLYNLILAPAVLDKRLSVATGCVGVTVMVLGPGQPKTVKIMPIRINDLIINGMKFIIFLLESNSL